MFELIIVYVKVIFILVFLLEFVIFVYLKIFFLVGSIGLIEFSSNFVECYYVCGVF